MPLNPQMTYSQKGLALTEQFEGVKLTAYQDVVGIWTIGFGHVGPEVVKGLKISLGAAQTLLASDVQRAANAVNAYVNVPITQGQFDALVDFTFNAGIGNFQKSTLLKLINAGVHTGVSLQFAKWVYAGGKVFGGLVNRRKAEAEEFDSK